MADNASEEDVRRMCMDELCEILDRENVDYSALEDIEEIRDLVLQSIAQRESPNNEGHSQKEATIDVMGRILERDAEMRKVISEIYDSVLAMLTMENFEKNLGSEMTKEYNGYIRTVDKYRKQLERTHCPIVVAGETGAGKSSLLNLIMGEHVLPRQVLSSTSTICQIFNSEQKRAVVTDENGRKFKLDDVTEETLSQYVCVDRSGENKQRYKTVDIYWPVPMLKEHATIVDTPGVGESDEMTTKLLDYLSEAVAFIYVINTTNAGGVQDDRLVKIFKKQLELEQKGLLQQFDPECAIFVCNKWDQVPDREDEMVWKDIAKKLQANWPTKRNMDITGQMFKMSVTKDLQRSKAGLGYSKKFKSLISGIDRLVSASLERRVKKHVDWLQSFLDRLLIKVIAKINASRKNQEEKKAMKSEIEKRLIKLECETENVKIKMESEAEKECEFIADKLTAHLNEEETKQKMFQWRTDELPDDRDLDVIQYKAKQLIADKINSQIVHWCQEHHIADTSSKLFDKFIEECKLIKGNFCEIDQIIQGIKPPIADGNLPQAAETSSDFDSSRSFAIFPLQERIALIAFAPLWLPLVIGASVLALPVAVGMIIKDAIEERRKIMEYRERKLAHILELAEIEIKYYSKDLVLDGLRVTYLRDFKASLEQVCENVIPKQIKADQELIENIVKEDRDSQTLKQEYTPIETKCKEIIGNLLYAKIKYLSDCHPRVLKEIELLGRGSFAIVLLCDVDIGGAKLQCAVKRMTSSIRLDPYLQLSEATNMKAFQHPNIVQCKGVSIEKTGSQKEYLNIFMEVCDCSLADVILCDRHIMEMCQCNSYRRKTCHMFKEKDRSVPEFVEAWELFTKMLEDILNGLVYLHDKGFVHRDLKLTNILIKDKTAKIADVGMSKPKTHLQGTITGTPVFMAPEVLEGRMYGLSADIFSLAVMIWEMWYGRRVFSESVYSDVMTTYSSIKEHVVSGQRPKFTEKTVPPQEIQTMMEECWVEVADDRPTARQLTTRLKEIGDDLTFTKPC